jgi:hypothetical protein
VCVSVVYLHSFLVRLLDQNPSAMLLWRTYCSSDEVLVSTFVAAVRQYLKDLLHLSDDDVALLLSDKNVAALVCAVDADGNGRVCDDALHCGRCRRTGLHQLTATSLQVSHGTPFRFPGLHRRDQALVQSPKPGPLGVADHRH